MGVKGWIALGVGGLALLGGILGKTRKRGRYEGVIETINAVDLKSETQNDEGPTVEEMTADVEQAVGGMDMDEELEKAWTVNNAIEDPEGFREALKDCWNNRNGQTIFGENGVVFTRTIDKEVDDVIKHGNEVLKRTNQMLNGEEERTKEELRKARIAEAYIAIKRKDFGKMEDIFDALYAGGPWHPAPCSVFNDAYRDGLITDELLKEAEKHFGRLWNYSGD